MSEQHSCERTTSRHTQNSNTVQFVRNSESTNVTVQNIQHGK